MRMLLAFWRRERDSNPRVLSHKLISSQPRYDHFDISPYSILLFGGLEDQTDFDVSTTLPLQVGYDSFDISPNIDVEGVSPATFRLYHKQN